VNDPTPRWTDGPIVSVGLLIARVLVGGLFVFAGVIKLQDPQQFAFSVAAFKIFPEGAIGDPLTLLATFAFPWAEILLGAMLILGVWTRSAALLTVLLLAGFIGAITSVLVREMSVTCGCFGKIDFICGETLGVCSIIRNSVMLGITLLPLALGSGQFGIDGLLRWWNEKNNAA